MLFQKCLLAGFIAFIFRRKGDDVAGLFENHHLGTWNPVAGVAGVFKVHVVVVFSVEDEGRYRDPVQRQVVIQVPADLNIVVKSGASLCHGCHRVDEPSGKVDHRRVIGYFTQNRFEGLPRSFDPDETMVFIALLG